jgi:S1-C subfamily serine protease
VRHCWRHSALVAAATTLLVLPSSQLSAAAAAKSSAIARATQSVVTVQTTNELGTAFAYGSPGSFITNAHVVGNSRQVLLTAASGAAVSGTVVRSDSNLDLAEIHAALAVPSLPADPHPVSAGDPVYAIGTPLRPGLAGSVTSGVVSAVRSGAPHGAAIQTDAPLNPGDSGGPLLDPKGQVIAINESKLGQAAGISFSIPISHATELARRPLLSRRNASSTSTTVIISVSVVGAIVLAAIAFAVISRRRKTIRVKLRGTATRETFEPDPRVQLKTKPSVELPTKQE